MPTSPNLSSAYGTRPYTPNQATGGTNPSIYTPPMSAAPAPFVISGLKANQPGNLNSTGTNTLSKSQTASTPNQTATGTSYQGVAIPSGLSPTDLQSFIQSVNINKGISSNGSTPASSSVAPTSVSSTYTGVNANGQSNAAGANNGAATPPITGNVTTPSGATINTTTGQGTPAQPNNTFPGLIGQIATSAQGNIPIGQNAQQIAAQYGQQIAQIGATAAGQEGQYLTGGGLMPTALGRAQTIGQTAGALQSAAAAGESAALQGTGQQLTAQNQQTAGLTGAASLSQPTSNFPFVFNPQTGQFTSSGAGGTSSSGTTGAPTLTYNPGTDASNLATAVIQGKVPYSDAVSAMSYAGSVAQGLLTSAIVAQGGNLTQIQAQQAVTQGNIQTLGTAAANATAASIGSQTTAVNDLSAARASVANIGNSLISQIAQNNNLNPSNINAVNQLIQTIAGQTSNPQYQTLLNQMTDVVATYASILNPGASTDTSRAQAATLLNQLSSGATVQQVISSLDQQAQEKISGIQTTLGNITNGQNVNPNSSLISGNSNGSTYNGIVLPH